MSQLMEDDPNYLMFRTDSIPLITLLDYICQKVYTDLMRLVDLLPSKTDLEKKIEIATFLSRTRHLFIRLLAVIKWANGATKVDKCEKISLFLEKQNHQLIDTANSLSRLLHNTLVNARLPAFAIYLAIDVFTNRTYSRLPNCIKNHFIQENEITKVEEEQAFLDLNRLILCRLSSMKLPKQFKKISIKNGRVKFTVPNEFNITLSLMSDSPSFPWRILKIEFLVHDEVYGYSTEIIHPMQVNFILKHLQQRILYRNIDPTPPLFNIYKSLHSFVMSFQLDLLNEQAQKAKRMRPIGQLCIEQYVPMQCLKVSYWRNLSLSNFHSSIGSEGKLFTQVYAITIQVDKLDPDRPLCVTHNPPLSIEDSYKIGVTISSSCISFERLLFKTMTLRAESIMKEIRRELLFLSPGPIKKGQIPLAIYVPLLWPCTDEETVEIKIHPTQGSIHASFVGLSTSPCSSILTGDQTLLSIIATQISIIEQALNRPTSRRTSEESQVSSSLLQRNLRSMNAEDAKFRQAIISAFTKLRQLVALQRIYHSAIMERGQILPVTRHLPIIFPENVSKKSEFMRITEAIQNNELFGLYVKLFPSNDYYLLIVIEASEDVQKIVFIHFLVICQPIMNLVDLKMSNENNSTIVANSIPVLNRAQLNYQGPLSAQNSAFLRVSHSVKLDLGKDNSFSQKSIFSIKDLEINQIHKLRCLMDMEKRSELKSLSISSNLIINQGINLLLNKVSESIWVSHFQEELTKSETNFSVIEKDDFGLPNVIQIHQFSSKYIPSWLLTKSNSLSKEIHSIYLFISFNHTAQNKSLNVQMNIIFKDFLANVVAQNLTTTETTKLFQNRISFRWPLTKLDGISDLIKNCIHMEWFNIISLYTLCEPYLFDKKKKLPTNVEFESYNLKSVTLKYGPARSYSVTINHTLQRNFVISFSRSRATGEDNDEHIGKSNPYHPFKLFFEEILNNVKNLSLFLKLLNQTLTFYELVMDLNTENLFLLTVYNQMDRCTPKVVREITIIVQSCFDVLVIFCKTLSLHFQLVLNNNSETMVRISDGYCVLGMSQTDHPNSIFQSMPLPAFKYFMATFEEFCNNDPEAIKQEDGSYLLKMETFKLLLEKPKATSEKLRHFIKRSIQPSVLELYLSISQQFHSIYASIVSLKAQLELPDGIPQPATMADQKNGLIYASSEISSRGELISRWFTSGLQTKIQMIPMTELIDENVRPINKVLLGTMQLKLQTLVSPAPNQVILWSQNDGLEVIEDYFTLRVVKYQNTLAAIRAFHQLLCIPTKVLRQLVRLLAWDLNPPKRYDLTTPIQQLYQAKLKINQAKTPQTASASEDTFGNPDSWTTKSDKNESPQVNQSTDLDSSIGSVQSQNGLTISIGLTGIAATGFSTSAHPNFPSLTPEMQPNLLGVFVRQPYVYLQLIISNSTPASQFKCFGQSVSVVYDWDRNQVSIIIPTLGTEENPNSTIHSRHTFLAHNLKSNEIDLLSSKQANQQNKCALLHFICMIAGRLTQSPQQQQQQQQQDPMSQATTPQQHIPPASSPYGSIQQTSTPQSYYNQPQQSPYNNSSSQNTPQGPIGPQSGHHPQQLTPQQQQQYSHPNSAQCPSMPNSVGQPNTPL